MPENLREGSGENDTISQLVKLPVGRNNVKSFECCSGFSGYMIGQSYSLQNLNGLKNTMMSV